MREADMIPELGRINGGAPSAGVAACGIGTAGTSAQTNALEGISQTDGPAIGQFPVGVDLQTVSLAMRRVLVEERLDEVGRRRRAFEERGTRLDRILVVVIVVIE